MRQPKTMPWPCDSLEELVARILVELAELFKHEKAKWTIRTARDDSNGGHVRFEVTIESGGTDRYRVSIGDPRLYPTTHSFLVAAQSLRKLASDRREENRKIADEDLRAAQASMK